MTIRKADKADLELLRELWEEFQVEVPEVEHYRETWAEALPDVERYVTQDVALVAEEDGQPAGFALARPGTSASVTSATSTCARPSVAAASRASSWRPLRPRSAPSCSPSRSA